MPSISNSLNSCFFKAVVFNLGSRVDIYVHSSITFALFEF